MNLLKAITILLIFTACSSVPRFTSSNQMDSENYVLEDLSTYSDYPSLETTFGTASFYADKYHGRMTYSGEIFDMNKISAAHITYPMNTIVRVTNLSNNKSIILRINDRMPLFKDRIIDLSYAAAKELDFVNDGLAKVKIEVLKWGDGKK
ncbi:MAG: septal ring lytic transglycosylase RlpA family protein [Melioribacter sp.]|uniref:septal ring lytic transglycosylase RlpA family protein n=1 Tax=Rosettibacter primus TaxID=3111523 RepID=UPI00247CD3A7|nr:septal ring lytic transglycosylase RlpA family protein [Melioribacter sp.]